MLFLSFAVAVSAQVASKGKTFPPPGHSDFANVSYGPYERNVLDIYLAKSGKPTPLLIHIHGGSFTSGDKNKLSPILLEDCLKAGISVASINYRYATQAPYPAQYQDSARALQFLRLHAKEYNLNKLAAATGDSAGAVVSLWLAFHDDLADPKNDDPVKRQSTRLSSAGVVAAQTTSDPRTMAKLIGDSVWQRPSIPTYYGLRPDEMKTERAYKMYEEASPDNYLTKDDPPVFLYYAVPNQPLTPDTPDAQRGHHPVYGFYLKPLMDKLGIECIVRLREDYKVKTQQDALIPMNQEMVQFFQKHFAQ
jgi:acetyl esterase/lipase